MRRREFIGLVGSAAAAWPIVARAQNSNKIFRIAVFPDFSSPLLADWFSAEMHDHGWTEGRDLIIEQFGSKVSDLQLGEAAQRVVASKPDLIVTISTAHALALQRATGSIPIVMMSSGYPVEAGLADSLSKPGRNVTGNALYAATGVWGKMLQLLRDAKPNIERVGVLWTYVVPAFPKEEIEPCYAELERGARSFGLKLQIVEVTNSNPLQAALAEIEAGKPDGLVLTSLFAPDAASVVTQFAVDKGLPTIVDFDWAPFGVSPLSLLSYGPVFRGLVVRAAASVDKILRGSKPGDVPIQNPDKFEMVVNLKTAKAIGLSLPEAFLLLADKVTE
jgi:putative tryptophan/tyrosine transport system substrate-binding protein